MQARHESTDCGMKQILAEIIPEKQREVKEFRAKSGNMVVGDVTVDMVSAGHLTSDQSDASGTFLCLPLFSVAYACTPSNLEYEYAAAGVRRSPKLN